MPDMYIDVDVALTEVPVNIVPLLDDTDFKTRETTVAYDAAGMDLRWNFVTTAGAYTSTAVVPTTGGDYDWAHQGDGMYSIEIPASGGASINNDTEGFGWFSGVATGVLPWRGPVIGFRPARLNNLLIDDGNLLDDLFRLLMRSDAAIGNDAAATLTIINANRGTGAGSFDNTAAPTVALTSTYNLYHADIHVTRDEANTREEFTVTWFKNGVRLTSGVTSPTIQVVKRADGADLIAATALTEIGTTESFRYNASGAERLTAGEAVIAIVAGTIDGSARTFSRVLGRDATS